MAEKVASCFYESFSSMYRNAAFVERQSRFCTIYLFEYETGKSFSDLADDRHFGCDSRSFHMGIFKEK